MHDCFNTFLHYIIPRPSTIKKMKRKVRSLTGRTPTLDNIG